MKLVSYGERGAEQPGVLVEEERIVPLAPLLEELGLRGADMCVVVGLLDVILPLIEETVAASNGGAVRLSETRLGPPIPHPEKILVIGGNYQSHVDEAKAITKGIPPSRPIIVFKPPSNIVGPYDPIVRPLGTTKLDYEGELAVVIGRGGRRITRERAMDHVAGYMNGDDVGDRAVMMGDGLEIGLYMQPTRGKGYDTFCPIGPWLATKDEIDDPHDLSLRVWVNDELRQDGSTAEMLVDIPGLIEDASSVMRLSPGDVLLTGTPEGCGGMRNPPIFLQPGDVVRQEISGMGVMENPIVDET
jgi:2-keto-4-pentenoate hydratase/2-oxohepta-3-ene-1,7-dioic acid hydratase in catechol pathway